MFVNNPDLLEPMPAHHQAVMEIIKDAGVYRIYTGPLLPDQRLIQVDVQQQYDFECVSFCRIGMSSLLGLRHLYVPNYKCYVPYPLEFSVIGLIGDGFIDVLPTMSGEGFTYRKIPLYAFLEAMKK